MKFDVTELLFQTTFWVTKTGVLLGQAEGAEIAEEAAPAVNPFVQFFASPINLFLICAMLFMFIVVRPQQKQARQLQDRLKELKKNDRIVTASGIHGTVVQAGDDETISIRIDENTGTRIKINREAIAKIITPENKG